MMILSNFRDCVIGNGQFLKKLMNVSMKKELLKTKEYKNLRKQCLNGID